jgi:hypothetical protein
MLRYIKRLSLFLIPFFMCFLVYVVTDPFMIVHNYDNFNKRSFINKNRDYISSEMLMNNSRKYKYDSFVLGASTSLAFAPSVWKEFIHPDSLCYSFDASGECLDGIWSKVKFLDTNSFQVNKALIILEANAFTSFINDVPLFMKHPEVYPSSKWFFHYASFLSFMELKFQVAILTHLLTGRFYPFMEETLIASSYEYDTITNEFYNIGLWEDIRRDSVGFYKKRANIFPRISDEFTEEKQQITDHHKDMLADIKEIFDKQKTDYRIIICPGLKRKSFNKEDLSVIVGIFGEKHVFDFSGINEFSENVGDYTDATHFKRYLARRMLEIAYSPANDEITP